MPRRVIPRLHVVTDDGVLSRADFRGRALEALEAGGPMAFHLRGPHTTGRRIMELARALRVPAASAGVTLLVNDRVDVALCLALDGAHLGRRSLPPDEARALLGPDRLVGASVHDAEEATQAARGGADFLIVGALWATPSHSGETPMGPQLIRDVGAAVSVPLVGIGGVTPERVAEIVEAGGHGAAVVGGIWDAPSSGDAVQAYLQALG